MGSKSDLPIMQEAANILKELGVAYEINVVSAHRTPELMFEYAKDAHNRGIKVIIAGAGGAAHLPGMTASLTPLPVIGVPIKSSNSTSMSQIANIKAKNHLNKFLNGSFISSDFVMTTQENVSQVDSLKAYQAKIMEVFKEQSSGVVAGLELLSSFDVDSTKKVFIYLRNKL